MARLFDPLARRGFITTATPTPATPGIPQATLPDANLLFTDTYLINQSYSGTIPAPTGTLVGGTSLIFSKLVYTAATFSNYSLVGTPNLTVGRTYSVSMLYDGANYLVSHTSEISTIVSTGITVESFVPSQPYQEMPLIITINGVSAGTPSGSVFRIKYYNADDVDNATIDTSIGNLANNYSSSAGATQVGVSTDWRLDAKYIPGAGSDRTWVFVEVDVADSNGTVAATYNAKINLTEVLSVYWSTFAETDGDEDGALNYNSNEIEPSSGANVSYSVQSNYNKGYAAQRITAPAGGFSASDFPTSNKMVDGATYVFNGTISSNARTSLQVFNTLPGRINGVTTIDLIAASTGNSSTITEYTQSFTYANNAGADQELLLSLINSSASKQGDFQFAILRTA